jgi:hypothetical protein
LLRAATRQQEKAEYQKIKLGDKSDHHRMIY